MRARSSSSRFPGLDGLRAVAVAAVLAYHLDPSLLPGGFLGVDLFFVLSGFLITSLLLAGITDRRVDLRGFWRRRIRRLVPAVIVLLAGVLAVVTAVLPGEADRLRRDALAALAWVTNWQLIAGGESYFEAASRPSLLRHLWSLAVEAQLYLVWPLVLAVGVRIGRAGPPILAIGLAAASVGWMAAIAQPGEDPSRIYFGTDTRAFPLLLGAALATVLSRLPAVRWARVRAAGRSVLAIGAAAVVGAGFVLADAYEPLLYPWGLLAFAAAATVLIGVVVGGGPVTWLLEPALLRWLGERSYAVYLWHWPMVQLTRPDVDVPLGPLPAAAVCVTVTLVLAELSFRLVERPIREHGFRLPRLPSPRRGTAVPLLAFTGPTPPKPRLWPSFLASAATGAVAVALAAGTVIPGPVTATPAWADPSMDPVTGDATATIDIASPSPTATATATAVSVAGPPFGRPRGRPAWRPLAWSVPPPAVDPTPSPTPRQAGPPVLAIGDSVMLSAEDELQRRIPGIEVDALVGRYLDGGRKILGRHRANGTLPEVVVVHLGNNEPFWHRDIESVMELLQDRRLVVFVNLKLPRDWERHNNRVLALAVPKYPNAVLVDWRGTSLRRGELFWQDGYHLRHEGGVLYADLLARTIAERAPELLPPG